MANFRPLVLVLVAVTILIAVQGAESCLCRSRGVENCDCERPRCLPRVFRRTIKCDDDCSTEVIRPPRCGCPPTLPSIPLKRVRRGIHYDTRLYSDYGRKRRRHHHHIDSVTLDLARRLHRDRYHKVCEKSVHEYSKIPIDRPCHKHCCNKDDHHVLYAIDKTIYQLRRKPKCSSEEKSCSSEEKSCSSEEDSSEESDYRRARRRFRRRLWRLRHKLSSKEHCSEESCSKSCSKECDKDCHNHHHHRHHRNHKHKDSCESNSSGAIKHHHISNNFFNLFSPTRFLPRIAIS